MRILTMAVALVATLSGCGADPLRNVYVLGDAPPSRPADIPQLGKPLVEVKPTLLPDYLDTTDIVIRGRDRQLIASTTGRWGERLSIGVTHAVDLALAAKLPQFAVTDYPTDSTAWRQILIDIVAFETLADGNCVLDARWAIRSGRTGDPIDEQRAVFVTQVTAPGDVPIVAAMSRNVDMLAARIAEELQARPAGEAADGRSRTRSRGQRS